MVIINIPPLRYIMLITYYANYTEYGLYNIQENYLVTVLQLYYFKHVRLAYFMVICAHCHLTWI